MFCDKDTYYYDLYWKMCEYEVLSSKSAIIASSWLHLTASLISKNEYNGANFWTVSSNGSHGVESPECSCESLNRERRKHSLKVTKIVGCISDVRKEVLDY